MRALAKKYSIIIVRREKWAELPGGHVISERLKHLHYCQSLQIHIGSSIGSSVVFIWCLFENCRLLYLCVEITAMEHKCDPRQNWNEGVMCIWSFEVHTHSLFMLNNNNNKKPKSNLSSCLTTDFLWDLENLHMMCALEFLLSCSLYSPAFSTHNILL